MFNVPSKPLSTLFYTYNAAESASRGFGTTVPRLRGTAVGCAPARGLRRVVLPIGV
jgi:hypothetical protein